jgi:hypothetical protein
MPGNDNISIVMFPGDSVLADQTPKPDKPQQADGFVCTGCGRVIYIINLAPLCTRCRQRARHVMLQTFACERCEQTFDKILSDHEVLAEMIQNFGPVPIEQQATICDDCYQEF